MEKNVLVTGGAGYIGSHTCKVLSDAGFTPVTVDNLVYGHEWAVKWGPLEIGDTRDSAAITRIFQKYRPVAVIHFAAYAYVGESVTDPHKYYDNNVAGTLGLLDAMLKTRTDKIVFSSTCATYGIPETSPIPESHRQAPINPYGQSKLMVVRILRDFDAAYGLRSVALRYFNAAGADPASGIGEAHEPETHLVPLILAAAMDATQAITVFGKDYDTPDGTCVRDYIHVRDLAAAHVKALTYLLDGGSSEAINLGTGTGLSVLEVIEAAKRVTGQDINVIEGQRRPGDPASLVASATRALRILDWEPVCSDIETIVETAWQWLRSQSSRSRAGVRAVDLT